MGFRLIGFQVSTLPETNIATENRPSHKESSFPSIHFHGRDVSFREGIPHVYTPTYCLTREESSNAKILTAILTPPCLRLGKDVSTWPYYLNRHKLKKRIPGHIGTPQKGPKR